MRIYRYIIYTCVIIALHPAVTLRNTLIFQIGAINDRMMEISLMFAPLLRFAPCCIFARQRVVMITGLSPLLTFSLECKLMLCCRVDGRLHAPY